ncbi:MAG: DNA alkylation repair protein [Fibrobacterales bacterium]|nr:DNA alkylation repair protein [Fibrobacterales bacterium]
MTRAELLRKLRAARDPGYREFHAALVPNVPKETILGVRVPTLRRLAADFAKNAAPGELERFLDDLPHRFFEENQIHMFVVSAIRDPAECLERLERFLPFVDNWAVCDGKTPKALLRDERLFRERIRAWLKSDRPYVVRFGIVTLMTWWLDERFDARVLREVAAVKGTRFSDAAPARDRYYVRMAAAWFFATALARRWDEALPWVAGNRLEPWVRAKTIQKARESFRVTPAQKEELRRLGRGDGKRD